MTPQEMKQLAELLQNVPGMKSIELEDVQGLAQLLRDSPEIGSIEVKGLFGTKVVITRTGNGVPTVVAAPRRRTRAPRPPRAGAAPTPEHREAPRRGRRAQGDQVADGGHVLQVARAGRGSLRQGRAPGSRRARRSASSRR